MSTLKAQFTPAEAKRLLIAQGYKPRGLIALSGGEASQAYAFEDAGRELVLRVNKQFDYNRDLWAAGFIHDSRVPIPRIVAAGKHDYLFWAISARARGKMLGQLPQEELEALVPKIVETLHVVHSIDVSKSHGFGKVGPDGNGPFKSLMQFIEDFDIRGDYIEWDKTLKSAPSGYRKLIEEAWDFGGQLLGHVPEDARALCHGGFDMGNVIADAGTITGVIDWNDCVYADPLRDVAWTDFWSPELNFAKAYLERFPQRNAGARLTCYQLFMAARSLGFFVYTKQPEKAEWLLPLVESCVTRVQNLVRK